MSRQRAAIAGLASGGLLLLLCCCCLWLGRAQETTCSNDENGDSCNANNAAKTSTSYFKDYQIDEWGNALSTNHEHKKYNAMIPVDPYGFPQRVEGPQAQQTMQVLESMMEYMQSTTTISQKYMDKCLLRNDLCAFWAAIGECEVNPKYMTLQCAPACHTCDQLDFDTRCPLDLATMKEQDVWKTKGQLNAMFERLASTDFAQQHTPWNITVVSRDPWVITIDNVVSRQDCQRLIDLGHVRGYERSKDVGGQQFDGTYGGVTSDGRTSRNAWCVDECHDDPATQRILALQQELTGIPDMHNEHLQLLEYQEGQFYGVHHDYIRFHQKRAQGVRILTVFFYLNNVTEGGGTHFPKLNITVQPQEGRVVVWPSVRDSFPNKPDYRTDHEALPVVQGVKYGANSWVHQRDFKTPYRAGCS